MDTSYWGRSIGQIEIIETLYRAFKSKDYELFRNICDADIEWIPKKGFPNGGPHHRAEAVIQNVFKRFNDDWEYFKFDIEEMVESKDGSKVIVTGSYLGRHKRTRKLLEASAAHYYAIENQKVKRFQQLADTAMIVAAIES